MQWSLRDTDGMVLQYGNGIGNLIGGSTWQIPEAVLPNFLAAAAQPNGGITYVNGVLTILPPPPPPPPPPDYTTLRNAVIAQAQSTVGVSLSALTANQKLALLACLLYSVGGLDPVTLTVQPLNQWLRNP